MQKLNSIFAVAILGLASCSQVEEIQPVLEQNVVIRDVNITVQFDNTNHEVIDLDINDDGKTDFLFFAKSIAGPGWGDLAMVGVMAAKEGNQATATSSLPDKLCAMNLPMSPGRTLKETDDIDDAGVWATDAMLYGRTVMNDGCQEVKRYIDYSQNRYVGVRMFVRGELVYGWIRMVAVDTREGHYPQSAEVWKINQFGYGVEAGQTIRIPA